MKLKPFKWAWSIVVNAFVPSTSVHLFCLLGYNQTDLFSRYPNTPHSLLSLGICTCLPCLECFCLIFFWLIPHLWGFSLEDTCFKSLLSSPKSWVFPWWTLMGAQCFYCSAHHSVESDRLFPPLTFSLDFTLHESRNYVSFNSVASPGASTLCAWHLQDSR